MLFASHIPANFERAIQWLEEGKKVRRRCWKEDSYWTLGIDETIMWNDEKNAHIHIKQIKANDWGVYEDDDFCLEDEAFENEEACYIAGIFYHEKDVKKFIKRIDKDLELFEFKFRGSISVCDNPQKLKDIMIEDIYKLRKKIKKEAGDDLI